MGKDKNGFKLKLNVEKQLCLSIRQVSDNGPQLFIERCFGVLVAAGRHVRHSDMQLLEMVTFKQSINIPKWYFHVTILEGARWFEQHFPREELYAHLGIVGSHRAIF